MSNVSKWNKLASNNDAAPPDGAPEFMDAGKVNDTIREMMAAVARWYAEQNGSLQTGGSGNTYTLTTTNDHAALADLTVMVFRTDRTNSGAVTLKVDTLAAQPWRHADGSELVEGELKVGALQVVAYNASAGAFHQLGSLPAPVRRLAGQFAPHASVPAAMTVTVDAGFLLSDAGALITKAAQTAATIVAPTGNPRNDIVVLVGSTGAVAVRQGTESVIPGDPVVTAGDFPVARVRLTVGMTEITDADLDDLRTLFGRVGEASQAELEAESDVKKYVPPGLLKHHPGVAKFWCVFNGTVAGPITPSEGYNVIDVTDNGVGDYTVNVDTDFSAANWVPGGTSGRILGGSDALWSFNTLTAGTVRFNTRRNSDNAIGDPAIVAAWGFGDQA